MSKQPTVEALIKRDLDNISREVQDLRSDLQAVIRECTSALAALDKFQRPSWLEHGILGQSERDMREHAVRLNLMLSNAWGMPASLVEKAFQPTEGWAHVTFTLDEIRDALATDDEED